RDYLEHHQDEFVSLFNTILINVTSFFRDEAAWDYLAKDVVPRILAAKDDQPVRVWSTGCASGEEAYTIAIVLLEAMGEEAFKQRVKTYATDVDEDALAQGRHALYQEAVVEPVPADDCALRPPLPPPFHAGPPHSSHGPADLADRLACLAEHADVFERGGTGTHPRPVPFRPQSAWRALPRQVRVDREPHQAVLA